MVRNASILVEYFILSEDIINIVQQYVVITERFNPILERMPYSYMLTVVVKISVGEIQNKYRYLLLYNIVLNLEGNDKYHVLLGFI